MSATIEIQYFPSLLMVGLLKNNCYIEAHETYQKRSYRNKCLIASSRGPLSLSVPLRKGKNANTAIKKVTIAYEENWILQHLKSIKNSYENAPFFDYIYPQISSILKEQTPTLWELNWQILNWTCDEIGLNRPSHTKSYEPNLKNDFRDRFKPNQEPIEYKFCYYPQVFESALGFVPNLSSLDLLMNMGPESKEFLPKVHTECDR